MLSILLDPVTARLDGHFSALRLSRWPPQGSDDRTSRILVFIWLRKDLIAADDVSSDVNGDKYYVVDVIVEAIYAPNTVDVIREIIPGQPGLQA